MSVAEFRQAVTDIANQHFPQAKTVIEEKRGIELHLRVEIDETTFDSGIVIRHMILSGTLLAQNRVQNKYCVKSAKSSIRNLKSKIFKEARWSA